MAGEFGPHTTARMDELLHQPPLPPHTRCPFCRRELNMTIGVMYYEQVWYCLTCFGRGGAR